MPRLMLVGNGATPPSLADNGKDLASGRFVSSLASVRSMAKIACATPQLLLLPFTIALLATAVLWPNERNFDQAVAYLYVMLLFAGLATLMHLISRAFRIKLRTLSTRALRYPILGVVVAAIASFVWLTMTMTYSGMQSMYDGLAYFEMGKAFASRGDFYYWGGHSHHFPPLYPMYLSLFYKIDSSLEATKAAIIALYLLSVAVVFACTRHIYGLDNALLTCALVFTVPPFVFPSSRNYGEPLVLLTFTLTMFAILQSLRPGMRRWILLAGICAGLGYLSKSSVGYFFIIAGAVGFGWRYYYMRGGVIRERSYLLAILIFAAIFGVWSYRNLSLFWNGTPAGLIEAWQTSAWFTGAARYALTIEPASYALAVLFLGGCTALLLYTYWMILGHPTKLVLDRLREEEISGLVIAITIAAALAMMIGGVFYVEDSRTLSGSAVNLRHFYHNGRYLLIALLPLAWLAAAARPAGQAAPAVGDSMSPTKVESGGKTTSAGARVD